MPHLNKAFLRASHLLHEALTKRSADPNSLALPVRSWNDCLSLACTIELGAARDWQAAVYKRKQELVAELDMLQRALARLMEDLHEELRRKPLASESELYREIGRAHV
jgi:hypothetical protein